MSFLFFSLVTGQYLLNATTSLVTQLIATALLVTGWAATREPVTVLLYELWPLVQIKKTCRKISMMEIDIQPFTA